MLASCGKFASFNLNPTWEFERGSEELSIESFPTGGCITS